MKCKNYRPCRGNSALGRLENGYELENDNDRIICSYDVVVKFVSFVVFLLSSLVTGRSVI